MTSKKLLISSQKSTQYFVQAPCSCFSKGSKTYRIVMYNNKAIMMML